MKRSLLVSLAVALLAGPISGSAQNAPATGITVADLAMAQSKKTGKKFVLEPRVQAQVSLSSDPAKLSYDEFLTVLQVYGFVAVDSGDVVMVVPDASARSLPVPLVTGNEKRPDAEVVTKVIHVRSFPAALIVPILRPLIPQYGHLAALSCSNDLILVDRYGNVRRLEAIIQAMDKGQPYKPAECTTPAPAPAPRD